GSAYTANTIDHILRREPGVDFVWLMGGDNLAGFHKWQRWRDIAASVPFAVLDRPGTRHAALASPAAKALAPGRIPSGASHTLLQQSLPAWTYLDIALSDESSTALRGNTR
ncbi:MAG: nicotinic acid mononucleotide adenylyltransferase, partial [Hyphomicrobiaceae bacterium]